MGASVAGTWGWGRIQWVQVPEAVPWLSDVLAAFVLGLWGAFLLGVAFGHRLAASPPKPASAPGAR